MTARWERQVGGNVSVIVDEAGCIVIEQERQRGYVLTTPDQRAVIERFTVTNVAVLVDALHDAQDAAGA